MSVIIDNDLCNGCGRCVKACPVNAIVIDESARKAVVDPELCTGCLACMDSCKKGAIRLEPVMSKSGTTGRSTVSGGFFSGRGSTSANNRSGGIGGGYGRGRAGAGQGTGRRSGGTGSGRGRRSSGSGSGRDAGGECYCPSCCISIAHQPGVPCSSIRCPGCGGPMIRR